MTIGTCYPRPSLRKIRFRAWYKRPRFAIPPPSETTITNVRREMASANLRLPSCNVLVNRDPGNPGVTGVELRCWSFGLKNLHGTGSLFDGCSAAISLTTFDHLTVVTQEEQ